MAAAKVTPQAVNQMALHAPGPDLRADAGAHPTAASGHQPRWLRRTANRSQTDFAISVDARRRHHHRHQRLRPRRGRSGSLPIRPRSTQTCWCSLGHVFPAARAPRRRCYCSALAHTEAAVDLAQLAGLHPSGVICEILNEDGTLARVPDLIEYKQRAQSEADLDRGFDRVSPTPATDWIEHVLTRPL